MNVRVPSRVAEPLRILVNYEISRKPLKCLDMMASTQRAAQKPNFHVFRSLFGALILGWIADCYGRKIVYIFSTGLS